MKKIAIFDTTLRDGTQGTGINFTLKDKLDITQRLDDIGVDYIEGGFPLASKREAAYFEEVKSLDLKNSRVAAFGSTRKAGVKVEVDKYIEAMLNAETPAVVVVGKSWTRHVTEVIKTDLEENLAMIYESVEYLKKHGREVILDPEHFFDGYKDDPEYALKVLKTGTEAGAAVISLCDTNGGTLPSEIGQIIKNLPQDKLSPLGIHCHNDTGNAVANSLIAVEAGVVHVQGTINGWGERCGNANLCAIVPNLSLKMGYTTSLDKNLVELTELSRFTAEKANIIPDRRQPYVGEAAFSHKAGQHADVVEKSSELIEHIDSSLVGNSRKILLSELAGRSTIVKKLEKYGNFDKKSDTVSRLITTLKEREMAGYEYEYAEASFDLLIRKALGMYKPLFELQNYHLESFKTLSENSKTVGRIFLKSNGVEHMGAGVGEGPVETLDMALRHALTQTYDFLDQIHLIDYRVRVLEPERSTAAKVRVFITCTAGDNTWDTVGVSENIIEASWEALVDSVEYYYNKFVVE